MTALQADELFACLDRHGVRYVPIGDLAALPHGSPLPTLGADICPSREPDNLARLATALGELDARIRTPDAAEGVRFPHEAAFLANTDLLNLVTRLGDLDLAFAPVGTQGFADLDSRAIPNPRCEGGGRGPRGRYPVQGGGEPAQGSSNPAVLRQLLGEVRKRRRGQE